MYESDITKFIREFLRKHPEEIESQQAGRAAWWDKKPEERSPVLPLGHSPRAGGNEHTFAVPDEEKKP